MSRADDKAASDDGFTNFTDAVDLQTFSQILEMDEPGDNEFSQSIVFGFFDQAEETFEQMNDALEKTDLPGLSALGHFLKGSSATLGLVRVRDACEKIQRYGKLENDDGSPLPDEGECLRRIRDAFDVVQSEYRIVEKELKNYYDAN